jgi:hypothetical protein
MERPIWTPEDEERLDHLHRMDSDSMLESEIEEYRTLRNKKDASQGYDPWEEYRFVRDAERASW